MAVSRAGSGRRGDQRRVAQWARRALAAAGEGGELSVLLCDDAFIRPLNAEYRDRDVATDVLSFPQDGAGGAVLGDVVISVETAARQAEQLGHSLDAELAVLLIHGLCHLLGHDHHDAEASARMAELEAKLLAAIPLDGRLLGLVARAG